MAMRPEPYPPSTLTNNSISNSVGQFDPPLQRLDAVLMRLTQLEDRIHGTGPKVVNSAPSGDDAVPHNLLSSINQRANRLGDLAEKLDAVSGRIEELIGDIR